MAQQMDKQEIKNESLTGGGIPEDHYEQRCLRLEGELHDADREDLRSSGKPHVVKMTPLSWRISKP